jgi:hypothetical protein
MPSSFPTKPVNASEDLGRIPTKPVRHFPAIEGDQAIPTIVEPVQIAGVSAYFVPTGAQQQQPAYGVPRLTILLSGK